MGDRHCYRGDTVYTHKVRANYHVIVYPARHLHSSLLGTTLEQSANICKFLTDGEWWDEGTETEGGRGGKRGNVAYKARI